MRELKSHGLDKIHMNIWRGGRWGMKMSSLNWIFEEPGKTEEIPVWLTFQKKRERERDSTKHKPKDSICVLGKILHWITKTLVCYTWKKSIDDKE